MAWGDRRATNTARHFVHVRLDDDQYEALQREAERQRTGMATVMRQALDLLLKTRQQ